MKQFDIMVSPTDALLETLTAEQRERLFKKMPLVEKAAARLASGMLKGVLKYGKDDWTIREWLDYGIDDAGDNLNYWHLLEAEYERATS